MALFLSGPHKVTAVKFGGFSHLGPRHTFEPHGGRGEGLIPTGDRVGFRARILVFCRADGPGLYTRHFVE